METKEQKRVKDYPPHVQDAINAAIRSGEKLRERKRALGQKLVIWKDGKVVAVDP